MRYRRRVDDTAFENAESTGEEAPEPTELDLLHALLDEQRRTNQLLRDLTLSVDSLGVALTDSRQD